MSRQELLFAKKNLSIVQLAPVDAKRHSDRLRCLRELVVTNEEMYPGINRWFDGKVVPGLVTEERTAFLGFVDGRPVASSIVKRGANAKFCHLRIGKDVQDQHLGELFFALMAVQVRNTAREIHFTLPEGLWEQRSEFFRSFGFSERHESGRQYRLFERELRCSAPFAHVWGAALSKIPKLVSAFSTDGFALDSSLLLSLKPRHAEAILSGRKTVELRRVFSRRWEGHRASIYATSPVMSLVGEARIARVVSASPGDIWAQYGDAIGCDRTSFDAYVGKKAAMFAIELADVRPFARSVGISCLADMIGARPRAPQSYASLVSTSVWGRCVSLAALLNGGGESRSGYAEANGSRIPVALNEQ